MNSTHQRWHYHCVYCGSAGRTDLHMELYPCGADVHAMNRHHSYSCWLAAEVCNCDDIWIVGDNINVITMMVRMILRLCILYDHIRIGDDMMITN